MDLGTYKSIDAEIWFGGRSWGDTKALSAIFEILIFCDFSGGQSPKMAALDQNLAKVAEQSKKSLPYDFVSPQNLSPNQMSASMDL